MAPAEMTKAEALDRVAQLEAELAAAKTAAGDSPLLDKIATERHRFWLESGKTYEMVAGKRTLVKDDPRLRVVPTVLRISPDGAAVVRDHLKNLQTDPGAKHSDAKIAEAEAKAHDERVRAKYADMEIVEDPNLHGAEAFVLE